ncbi:MAG: addiction module antitoxin [Candidatus Handelsmanbacteria bacterium RIFCSPLOWO2_12_FULL_64_10]|uniref:Addiction module antitoxin n=1 Tax=Handelsmanbacteria sp. (strain RIFCSPLOWO2_12_FULL_64_10) TaxID=1817868 RepID=A0A1F6CY71_HANXR|nr:MAG: addiction module antitoxin [Candidatus Handelsmanbacteria bacterium RIFCSPLOWO2_12_FULL_64_10]
MYEVRILDAAARELAQIDKPVGRRIVARIRWLAENLDNIKLEALTGNLSGLYKLRAGDYRILYEVLQEEQTIVVHKIGHRREIYRRR